MKRSETQRQIRIARVAYLRQELTVKEYLFVRKYWLSGGKI